MKYWERNVKKSIFCPFQTMWGFPASPLQVSLSYYTALYSFVPPLCLEKSDNPFDHIYLERIRFKVEKCQFLLHFYIYLIIIIASPNHLSTLWIILLWYNRYIYRNDKSHSLMNTKPTTLVDQKHPLPSSRLLLTPKITFINRHHTTIRYAIELLTLPTPCNITTHSI